jgi:hypothetical protein
VPVLDVVYPPDPWSPKIRNPKFQTLFIHLANHDERLTGRRVPLFLLEEVHQIFAIEPISA